MKLLFSKETIIRSETGLGFQPMNYSGSFKRLAPIDESQKGRQHPLTALMTGNIISSKRAKSQARWCMLLIPALGSWRQADFWVQSQPGLHSDFQDSHNYTEKLCLGLSAVWIGTSDPYSRRASCGFVPATWPVLQFTPETCYQSAYTQPSAKS